MNFKQIYYIKIATENCHFVEEQGEGWNEVNMICWNDILDLSVRRCLLYRLGKKTQGHTPG